MNRGFTLLEVVITGVIIALSLYAVQTLTLAGRARAVRVTVAQTFVYALTDNLSSAMRIAPAAVRDGHFNFATLDILRQRTDGASTDCTSGCSPSTFSRYALQAIRGSIEAVACYAADGGVNRRLIVKPPPQRNVCLRDISIACVVNGTTHTTSPYHCGDTTFATITMALTAYGSIDDDALSEAAVLDDFHWVGRY